MASGHGWLAGDWPSTGSVLNITAAAWTAGFHWWHSGNKTRMQNVSQCMLVLALCLVVHVLGPLHSAFVSRQVPHRQVTAKRFGHDRSKCVGFIKLT